MPPRAIVRRNVREVRIKKSFQRVTAANQSDSCSLVVLAAGATFSPQRKCFGKYLHIQHPTYHPRTTHPSRRQGACAALFSTTARPATSLKKLCAKLRTHRLLRGLDSSHLRLGALVISEGAIGSPKG